MKVLGIRPVTGLELKLELSLVAVLLRHAQRNESSLWKESEKLMRHQKEQEDASYFYKHLIVKSFGYLEKWLVKEDFIGRQQTCIFGDWGRFDYLRFLAFLFFLLL